MAAVTLLTIGGCSRDDHAAEPLETIDFSHARLAVWTDSGNEYYTKIL